ncbi:hypothetical protein OKW23_001060 [Bacilli bacterium PM5-9]|nr:hypothetical protein [Bacilli bacterium PM5-9]
MKKFIVLLFMLFFAFENDAVNAACNDNGQNLSKGHIISEYNCETGELYAYGLNKFGALGTGNYQDVTEANKIKINSKIGNRKIIDYFITSGNMYVLTNDNKVYATGIKVADGSEKRNTFNEIYFYKQSKNKILSLNGKQLWNGDISSVSYSKYSIDFKVSKNIQYYFGKLGIPICDGPLNMSINRYYNCDLEGKSYPIYIEEKNKTGLVQAEINRKR